MPSQTAHRVALSDLRLSEQLGIVVSSWFYRSCSSLFVDHPFFTIALHEPVCFSNACSLRRSRSAAQLNVGNRRASRGVTERYEGLRRSPLKPTTSAIGQNRKSSMRAHVFCFAPESGHCGTESASPFRGQLRKFPELDTGIRKPEPPRQSATAVIGLPGSCGDSP